MAVIQFELIKDKKIKLIFKANNLNEAQQRAKQFIKDKNDIVSLYQLRTTKIVFEYYDIN